MPPLRGHRQPPGRRPSAGKGAAPMVMPPSVPHQPGRSPRGRSQVRLAALAAALLLLAGWLPAVAQDAAPIQLKIVGGLAGVAQYTATRPPSGPPRSRAHPGPGPGGDRPLRPQRHPRPGHAAADAAGRGVLRDHPSGGGGGRRAGVECAWTCRCSTRTSPRCGSRWRCGGPRLERLLLERYGIELLAVYTYPAQVVFCRDAFARLDDLRGPPGPGLLGRPGGADGGAGGDAGGDPLRRDHAGDAQPGGGLRGDRIAVRQCARAADGHLAPVPPGDQLGSHRLRRQPGHLARPAGGRCGTSCGTGWRELEEEIWQAAGRETEEGFACNAGRPSAAWARPAPWSCSRIRRRSGGGATSCCAMRWCRLGAALRQRLRRGLECHHRPVRGILAPEG